MNTDNDAGLCRSLQIDDKCGDQVTICHVSDVFNDDMIRRLKTDVERVPLETTSSDLSNFKQSEDLYIKDLFLKSQSNLPPSVTEFINFLKTDARRTVEQVFKIQTKHTVTSTISKYSKGDNLLCHDDRMGSRAVAFIFYLSDLSEGDGGKLRFFSVHPTKKTPLAGTHRKEILPKTNTLVLFRVNDTSYHEVEQMYTDNERVSINGWFHYQDPLSSDDVIPQAKICKSAILKITTPVVPVLPSDKILSQHFLSEENLKILRGHFKNTQETAVLVSEVLDRGFYGTCEEQLEGELCWKVKGPANFRFYETIPFQLSEPDICFGKTLVSINHLVNYLRSPGFLLILSTITDVEYAVFEESSVPPTCMVEVQRWKEGHYSLLVDTNVEKDIPCVEVTLFFKVNERIMGSLSNDSNLSGVIVHSSKPKALSDDFANNLACIKAQRIESEMMGNLLKPNHVQSGVLTRIFRLNRRYRQNLMRKRQLRSVDAIVRNKLYRIQEYRRNKEEVLYIPPEDNTMIISFVSKDATKFTRYIQMKNAASDPEVCYYAVTVSYFIT